MSILLLIITLLTSLYYFFKRDYERFLLSFVFFGTLIPAGLGYYTSGITFTYIRLAAVIFPVLILFNGTKSKINGELNKYIILYGFVLIFEIISSIASENKPNAYLGYLIDDIFQTIGILYMFSFLYYKIEIKSFTIKFLKIINIITLVLFFVGLLEFITKTNVYQLLGLSNSLNISYKGFHIRSQNIRVSSTFNETLLFAYYIALVLPLLFMTRKLEGFDKKLNFINSLNILLSLILIYIVQSRTALVMYFIALLIYFTFNFWVRLSKSIAFKKVYIYIIAIGVVFSISYFNTIFNSVNYFLGTHTKNYDDNSYRERSKQLDYVNYLIKTDAIVLGKGRINTYDLIDETNNQIRALDSMWIRVFLESGAIAVIFYAIILILPVLFIIGKKSYYNNSKMNSLFFGFFLSYIYMSTFSSNQDFRIMFFLLLFILFKYSQANQMKRLR